MSRSARVRPAAWRVALVATVVALVAGGCGFWPFESDRGSPPISFVNNTDETVQVVSLPPAGGEVILGNAMEPGRSSGRSDIGPCTTGALVARNEAGEDVDRLDEPLCQGETWWIGGEETAPSG